LKYFRLAVNCVGYWSYRPVPISENPKYTCKDVTVVIPSLEGDGDGLREAVSSVLRNDPYKVIIVTVDANRHQAEAMANFFSKRIEVHSISRANKRLQICAALPYLETDITIFADDDVLWPPTLLPWILAPFEKESVGGVGTSQRLRREQSPNIWNFLGAAYLLRRNWDIMSCNSLDGGLPCLSGRTAAYRTCIVNDDEFENAFTHETWRSYQLNADDDNFLTRWLMNNGWDIRIQSHHECEIETTLEGNSKYLLQCHRWSRSNWRSNLKSLVSERTVWR
jgi:cellulose synthase/poly-beta-1,6-N-acetylglucosamine synthase-like glycosyltransferase